MAFITTLVASTFSWEVVVILEFNLGFINKVKGVPLLHDDTDTSSSYSIIILSLYLCSLENLHFFTKFAVLLLIITFFVIIVSFYFVNHTWPFVHNLLW